MSDSFHELPGLKVTLDRLVRAPQLSAPPEKPHPFAYFLTIHNGSDDRLILLKRKWVLSAATGEVEVVEGAGIVGQTPELAPGESFSYNSYHVIAGPTQISGAFFGETASGTQIAVKVPPFTIKPPQP